MKNKVFMYSFFIVGIISYFFFYKLYYLTDVLIYIFFLVFFVPAVFVCFLKYTNCKEIPEDLSLIMILSQFFFFLGILFVNFILSTSINKEELKNLKELQKNQQFEKVLKDLESKGLIEKCDTFSKIEYRLLKKNIKLSELKEESLKIKTNCKTK